MTETNQFKVFAGSKGESLAQRICDELACPLGNVRIDRFSDGEFCTYFEESVRGQSVYLVQPTCPSSDNLMELLLMIDAAKRASAYKVIAVIPYFVLTAFGGDVGFWSCFATTVAVMSAVYFIPTPGNSGAAEGTFFVVFSALSQGYVLWAMLVWRFFSYYIYIIMGPIIYWRMHLEKKKDADV